MSNLTRKTYTLGGLGCAHCAEKIQKGLSQLDPDARFLLNFSTGTLLLETANAERIPALMQDAQALINNIEPGVTLRVPEKGRTSGNNGFSRFEIRLGTALLFFFAALILPLSPSTETVLIILAYLIAG